MLTNTYKNMNVTYRFIFILLTCCVLSLAIGAQTPTFTPTATATCTPGYTSSTSTGNALVPGTTFVPGSRCDDCMTSVALPFPFTFYGTTFNSLNASSNGNLQFTSSNSALTNSCLPASGMNNLISPHW